MKTRLAVIGMAIVILLGVSAPVLAATFGDIVNGTGAVGYGVINNSTAANAIGVSGAMRSTTASGSSMGVRGVNFGAGFGVYGAGTSGPGVYGKSSTGI